MALLTRANSRTRGAQILRTVAFLETASPEHRWVNDLVAVGMGRRIPDRVSYTLHEVL